MAPKTKDEATHKLEDMTTHEVGFVDAAANLRTFLFAKSDDASGEPMTTKKKTEKKDDETGKAMSLPTEARDQLIEGVHDALEKLTGVTQALKESVPDDTSEVPGELPRMIKDASEALGKVADSFMEVEETSAKPDGKTDDGKTDDEKDDAETEKAKRVTANRLNQLRAAKDTIDALLSDVDDDVVADADASTEKSQTTTEVLDALKLISGTLESMNKRLNVSEDAVEKANKTVSDAQEQIEKLKAELSDPGKSRSEQPEGPVTKSNDVEDLWPDDLSEHVVQKMHSNK